MSGIESKLNVQLKIAVLTDTSGQGGLQVHTCGLAAALAGRGHSVTILSFGDAGFASDLSATDGIRILEVASGQSFMKLNLDELRRGFGRVQADLAIVPKRSATPREPCRLDFAARLMFGRCVTIEHSLAPPMPPKSSARHLGGLLPGLALWWYREAYSRWVAGLAPTLVICVCEAIRRHVIDNGYYSTRKLRVVHNGVDSEHFRPDPIHRERERNRWGIDEGAFLLGAVGRLSREKQYDWAIEALAALIAGGRSDAHLVLVGTGPDEERLRQMVRERRLGNRVIFPGFNTRPAEVYPAIDLFLLPSKFEGLPLSMLEAMASGCVPVATDVGGVAECLPELDLGWLVPAGDRNAFTEAVRTAAACERELMDAMGSRARKHVVEFFDLARQMDELSRIIEEHAR